MTVRFRRWVSNYCRWYLSMIVVLPLPEMNKPKCRYRYSATRCSWPLGLHHVPCLSPCHTAWRAAQLLSWPLFFVDVCTVHRTRPLPPVPPPTATAGTTTTPWYHCCCRCCSRWRRCDTQTHVSSAALQVRPGAQTLTRTKIAQCVHAYTTCRCKH